MSVSFLHIKLQTFKPILYTFVVQFLFITQLVCQNYIDEPKIDTLLVDTVIKPTKTLAFDTVDINIKDDDIKSPVHYKALDSIVYDVENKMLYLYGNAEMKYDQTQVNSANVTFDWNTQTLTAEGIDSAGKNIETPILIQEGKTYEAKKMQYNFKTSKGKIFDVVTEDNGAFIHSEIVVKTPDNEWLSYKAKYTTCTNKEHPHFYIKAKKAKIIPNKIMVSGPANLIISGINTPLALPFAIFPINSGRRSGIILPQYGVDVSDGTFRFTNGGYFWAVNDYLSMGFTGSISTGGSFDFKVATDYKKRYKHNGNIILSYGRKMPADPIANKNEVESDYRIFWKHNMDSKADPNNDFNADVNFKSSTFNRNALIQDERILEVINQSNITYTRKFNEKPYNLDISAGHNLNNNTHLMSITLPEIGFNISTITPFKSKKISKKKKFYEKIAFRYNIRGKAQASSTDTTFFQEETLDLIKYGIRQELNINATYSVLKHFNFTPRFNYKEQWMFKREKQFFEEHYVYSSDTISDTLYTRSIMENGFFARRNFSTGASINTKLKGIYRFNKGPVKAMLHVLTPTLDYTYSPDFSLPMWNFYDSYHHEKNDEIIYYNQFEKTDLYGSGISKGETNRLNLTLTNTLEIKVLDKKDTANMYKKIPILKNFSISSGYNFAGDSIRKFQDVRISARTSFLDNLIGISGTLLYNPYSVNYNNKKISKMYQETHNKPLRFVSLNMNFNLNMRPKKNNKKSLSKSEYGTIGDLEYIANNPELYYDFDIPWSFTASYHMKLSNGYGTKRDTTVLGLGSVTFGGHIDITPKWIIDVRSGYDIKAKDLTITTFSLIRDLHCWEMSLNYTAYPISSQNFNFKIGVKSALLQDLKLTRKYQRNYYDSSF